MKSYAFLFWGYSVIWLALAGFLFYLLLRLRRTARRLDAIEETQAASARNDGQESRGS